MVKIEKTTYAGQYLIHLRFNTGEAGVVDLGEVLTKCAAAKPLLDFTEFAKFTLDEWPTLVWPCGFDLSPEMLYERATGKRPAWQHLEMVYEDKETYAGTK